MNLLHVTNIYFTLPYFLGDQLTYFANRGYNIHLICSPSEQLQPFARKHRCQSFAINISRQFGIVADLKSLAGLIKYIVRHHFDIVTGHTPKAGLLAMVAAKLCGVKKRIYFRHGLVYETASGFARKILIFSEKFATACATDVVCVSPYLIERSIADKLGSTKKLKLLGKGSSTGIDCKSKFNPQNIDATIQSDLKMKIGLADGNYVIGFVGRLVGDKGIIELVEAFKELYKRNPKARLLLVGPLEERDAVPLAVVETIKSHKGIKHVGLVEDGIEYYYSLMDLFVLPTHREGLGVALLEAQSMSIPVLTTQHTGAHDAIRPGLTGEFIETNAASIVNEVNKFMENRQLCKSYGAQGRKFIEQNFEEEYIWNETERLLYKA